MGNRIYSVGYPVGGTVEVVKTHDIYLDLDSMSMYQDTDELNYKKDLIGFLKFLIEPAGFTYDTEWKGQVFNLVNALYKFTIEDILKKISSLFNTYYTYDEILEYYNEFMRSKAYVVKRLTDANAVKNSIKQIFTWIPGERILNPEFGSKLRLLLYEQITDENHEKIISEIQHCITEWEPRVKLIDVSKITTVDDIEENTVHIQIKYRIKGLDDTEYSYIYSPSVFNR